MANRPQTRESFMRESCRRWWEGEYPPNDPNSSIVILPGRPRRHWTARVCRAALEYGSEHHQWLIGASIAARSLRATARTCTDDGENSAPRSLTKPSSQARQKRRAVSNDALRDRTRRRASYGLP
jgi:hypothetical protein